MDKIARYREIVCSVIAEYASHKPSIGEIKVERVIDSEHDHYQVMHVGWQDFRRIHGSVIHLDIINGKIWIQYDGTNRPVAEALLEAGVPHEDIVLAFHPEDVRPYTDFAVV